jgi:hypothetical protein
MRRGKIYDWLPLWRNKWLMGSTRWELDPAERGVFIDLLCLAGGDDGFIRANPTTPYPPEYLAHLLNVPLELLQRTVDKCVAVGKLSRLDDGLLYINSWDEYSLDSRRKREVMAAAKPDPEPDHDPDGHDPDPAPSNPPPETLKQPEEEKNTHTLDDTERSAGSTPEIRRVLGANDKATLDKTIDQLRPATARLTAELKAQEGKR